MIKNFIRSFVKKILRSLFRAGSRFPRADLYDFLISAADAFGIRKLVLDSEHGRYMIDVRDRAVGKALLLKGSYNLGETEWFLDALGPGLRKGAMIDIGANIGTTSIPLALGKRFPSFVAVEPEPGNFSMLEYNVRANGLAPVMSCHNIALSDTDGRFPMELSPDNFGDHRLHFGPNGRNEAYAESGRRTVDVECCTFDAFLRRTGLDAGGIALIKSDTQGNEGRVLKGAGALLKTDIPWLIELWPYGLERAGTGREEFMALFTGSFSSFIMRGDGGAAVKLPVSRLADIYGRFAGVDFGNILLLK